MNTAVRSPEEENLIASLADDSEYAFQLIYNRHYRRIYQLGIRYLKSSELAEEVVQDVFMKLWCNRHITKISSTIEGWLYTVAKNDILNRLKRIAHDWKALNTLKITQQKEDDSMQDNITNADYQLLVAQALRSLSAKQQSVFRLAREENLSYAQIAAQLKISPLTVKTHMSRALGHIRMFLNGHLNVVFIIISVVLLM